MSSSINSGFVFLAFFLFAPTAAGERNFSAPAPPAAKSATPESLSAAVEASSLDLEALSPARIQAIHDGNGRSVAVALQVGIVRDLPASSASWQRVEGGFAKRWSVHVAGARALRVALDIALAPAGLVARFASAGRVADAAPARTGTTWGPLVDGDRAIVEVFAPDGLTLGGIVARPARVAQYLVDTKSQWLAAPCEVDLACEARTDAVLARAGAASIKITWVEGYSAYACSATLLNPADGSFRPYVYTAAHCLGSQAAADSLVSVWLYEKAACGGEDARPAVQVQGGAQLLATSDTYDATLLRLNRPAPEGAVFAGWDATPPALGESLVALHHANGEVTKVSHGTVVPPPPYPRFSLAWTSGIVQGGSSGSGAFSRIDAPQADLLLRGGLSAASASCDAPGFGLYSRLDQAWPMVAPYLSVAAKYANATGLWWNAAEPGWGLLLNQQGDVTFAVLFTYGSDGHPAWLVASEMRAQDGGGIAGTLYRTRRGSVAAVGTMRVTLANANEATLQYVADGRAATKTISRQSFNGFAPVCTATAASRAGLATYQDLWWNPGDPGWGLGIAQQGDVLFVTLFAYDDAGRDTWLVASGVKRQADGSFAGDLYRTSTAALDADVKDVKVAPAGALRLAFSDGENGTLTLAVDGRSSTQRIARQVFGATPPACR